MDGRPPPSSIGTDGRRRRIGSDRRSIVAAASLRRFLRGGATAAVAGDRTRSPPRIFSAASKKMSATPLLWF